VEKGSKKCVSVVWIILIVLLAFVLGALGGYNYYMNQDTNNSSVIVSIPQTTKSASAIPIATQTDKSADRKTYKNKKLGFSFKYPSNFSIEKDNLPSTSPGNNLTLKDELAKEQPTMYLWVDPDGFGPFFPNITYTLEFTNNKIQIFQETNDETSENIEKGKTVIMTKPVDVYNHTYVMNFDYLDDGKDYEATFQEIIDSFEFTNQ